jgi:hypothetical protein
MIGPPTPLEQWGKCLHYFSWVEVAGVCIHLLLLSSTEVVLGMPILRFVKYHEGRQSCLLNFREHSKAQK